MVRFSRRLGALYRLLGSFAVLALLVSNVGVAQAEKYLGGSGWPAGHYDIIDSAGAPGVRCYYDAGGTLDKVVVIRPRLYASAAHGEQPVSFYAKVRWLDSTGRFADAFVDPLTKGSPVLQATVDTYAPFQHLTFQPYRYPTYGYAYVELTAQWRDRQTEEIYAGRSFLLEHYRRYQYRSDGSLVFRGDTTSACSVQLP